MPSRDDTLENPYTGEKLTFIVTTEETGGEWLQVRHYAPHPTVMGVAHFHPILTETFTVEQGRLRFKIDGRAHILNTGDSVTIQPGQVHEFENISDGELILLQDVRPAGNHQAMFEMIYTLAREGRMSANGAPKGLFTSALLWEKMDGYIAGIPPFLQHLLMGNLARLARLLGRS
ncbi:MAG: cupin domain-containing protein [Anaerolineae bacterium]